MDLKMPLMSGLKATKILKQIKPNLPVIAQTAYALKGEKEIAFDAGFDDFIAKPINSIELIKLIEKHL